MLHENHTDALFHFQDNLVVISDDSDSEVEFVHRTFKSQPGINRGQSDVSGEHKGNISSNFCWVFINRHTQSLSLKYSLCNTHKSPCIDEPK